ncbi:MAG: lytic transglycosylase domain-containing protein [Anaerolineae bacterium]|nr:lytic transglycosylase domain-containing protein [Anaerolineae bacterium]
MTGIYGDVSSSSLYQLFSRLLEIYLSERSFGSRTAHFAGDVAEGNMASFKNIICSVSKRYDVDAQLVEAVIQAESGFNAGAVSPSGAQGLMQLMPDTARELGVTDAFDPQQNVDGGVRYLRQLLDRYDGNVALALAAYNAGPGAVHAYGGIPPYRETQEYVGRVLQNYKMYQ